MRFSTLLINCSFHDATSQAVLNISGQVFVNNCQFTDNEYHYGHGVALSFPAQSTGVQLTIKIAISFLMDRPIFCCKVPLLPKTVQHQFTLYN